MIKNTKLSALTPSKQFKIFKSAFLSTLIFLIIVNLASLGMTGYFQYYFRFKFYGLEGYANLTNAKSNELKLFKYPVSII